MSLNKRNSIKSGSWEEAQGSDQWLDYEDAMSQASTIKEEVRSVRSEKFEVESRPVSSNCVPANFLSDIESAILRADIRPVTVDETEEITALGNRGIWANREEIANWTGNIAEYQINEDPNPEIITKRVKDELEYVQELAVRYLRPPPAPTPGDILITQEPNILPKPAPPLVIRQQPPRPVTPEPLLVREAPPVPPPAVGAKLITISGKRLPPPPRKVVVERLAPIPDKPRPVIVERWLPYTEKKRRVIFQAAPPDPVYCKPRNVIIQWEPPSVRIRQEVKFLGVVNANPAEYAQRYRDTLTVARDFPDIARSIPVQPGYVLAADYQYNPVHELEGDLSALKMIDLNREGLDMYRTYVTSAARSTTNSSTSITSSSVDAARFLRSQQPLGADEL